MSVASIAPTSQVAFAGAPPLASPVVSDTWKEPRSWQIPRRFSGCYILADELYRGVCGRGCTTPFHKENREPWMNESMEAHIRFLRQDVDVFVVGKFDLECVGKRVVYDVDETTRVVLQRHTSSTHPRDARFSRPWTFYLQRQFDDLHQMHH